MLIEGLTKDDHAIVRACSARGLGKFGPSTFRSLLLGLHDNNSNVRKAAGKAITDNFSIDLIDEEFEDKPA